MWIKKSDWLLEKLDAFIFFLHGHLRRYLYGGRRKRPWMSGLLICTQICRWRLCFLCQQTKPPKNYFLFAYTWRRRKKNEFRLITIIPCSQERKHSLFKKKYSCCFFLFLPEVFEFFFLALFIIVFSRLQMMKRELLWSHGFLVFRVYQWSASGIPSR